MSNSPEGLVTLILIMSPTFALMFDPPKLLVLEFVVRPTLNLNNSAKLESFDRRLNENELKLCHKGESHITSDLEFEPS
jgi:hypothetical protein